MTLDEIRAGRKIVLENTMWAITEYIKSKAQEEFMPPAADRLAETFTIWMEEIDKMLKPEYSDLLIEMIEGAGAVMFGPELEEKLCPICCWPMKAETEDMWFCANCNENGYDEGDEDDFSDGGEGG